MNCQLILHSVFDYVFSMFFDTLFFRFSSFFDFHLFRRYAFYPIKTMVLAHSTLSENLNSISNIIKIYQMSYQFRHHFRIDFSSLFMFFRHRFSNRLFPSIFDGKWLQKWIPGAPFSRPFPKVDLWRHLGRPLAPFGSFWLPFGSLLAPF